MSSPDAKPQTRNGSSPRSVLGRGRECAVDADEFRPMFPVALNGVPRSDAQALFIAALNAVYYSSECYVDPAKAGVPETFKNSEGQLSITYAKSLFLKDGKPTSCLDGGNVEGILEVALERQADPNDSAVTTETASKLLHQLRFLKNAPKARVRLGSRQVVIKTIPNSGNASSEKAYFLVRRQDFVDPEDVHLEIEIFDGDGKDSGPSAENGRSVTYPQSRDEIKSLSKSGGVVQGSGVVVLDKKSNTTVDYTVKYTPADHAEATALIDNMFPDNTASGLGRQPQSSPIAMVRSFWAAGDKRDYSVCDFQAVAFIENAGTDTQVNRRHISTHCSVLPPQAWVYADLQESRVLLCFRGTEPGNAEDVDTDLSETPAVMASMAADHRLLERSANLSRSNIKFHEGFLTSYEAVREAVFQVILDITEWNPCWKIWISGHSLGASISNICSFEFHNRTKDDGTRPGMALINFAALRSGNNEYAVAYDESCELSYRFAYSSDKFPLVFSEYEHCGTQVELTGELNGAAFTNPEATISGPHQERFFPLDAVSAGSTPDTGDDSPSFRDVWADSTSIRNHLYTTYYAAIRGVLKKLEESAAKPTPQNLTP